MIGIDIVAISRMERFVERFGQKGLERFLSASEIERTPKPASIAGLWAAKEAVAKALGCGIGRELGFHDIEITKSPKGAPILQFSERARSHFGITKSALSIAHDGGFAIAVSYLVCAES